MSVAVYFTKLKGLWDELSSYNDLPICTCGAMKKVEEREQRGRVMQFLMGLNESYSAVRGQIILMQPLSSVGKVYSMVLNEEKQRDLIVSKEAMLVDTRKNHYGSNPSHKAKMKLHCGNCNGNNHTIDRCYYLHGFPTGHKNHKNNDRHKGKNESFANNSKVETPNFTHEQYAQLWALLNNGDTQGKANVTGLVNEEDDWIGEAT
ncbi:uncharacterized protein [Henckelia pumila]|uniref:uncharacterized protein n=1 Tax=Henckelia pumila TaxID=405737 RepID=UPI003C6E6537